MQPRIVIPNHLQIALEDRNISNIKPDQSGEKSDICFGDMLPEEEW